MKYEESNKMGCAHGIMDAEVSDASEIAKALSYLENLVDKSHEETARLEKFLSPILCDPFPTEDTANGLETTCALGHQLARLAVQFKAHLTHLEQISRRTRTY